MSRTPSPPPLATLPNPAAPPAAAPPNSATTPAVPPIQPPPPPPLPIRQQQRLLHLDDQYQEAFYALVERMNGIREQCKLWSDRKAQLRSTMLSFASVQVSLLLGVALVSSLKGKDRKAERLCSVSYLTIAFVFVSTFAMFCWLFQFLFANNQLSENLTRKNELLDVWTDIKRQGFESPEIDAWFEEEPKCAGFGLTLVCAYFSVLWLLCIRVGLNCSS